MFCVWQCSLFSRYIWDQLGRDGTDIGRRHLHCIGSSKEGGKRIFARTNQKALLFAFLLSGIWFDKHIFFDNLFWKMALNVGQSLSDTESIQSFNMKIKFWKMALNVGQFLSDTESIHSFNMYKDKIFKNGS